MKRIKRIDPLSLAKIFGFLYGVLGLIGGLFFSVISLLTHGEPNGVPWFLGVGAIIFLPIMYGIGGSIMGAISGMLYNLAAKYTGGIKFEVE
jgi:hypothetical protein